MSRARIEQLKGVAAVAPMRLNREPTRNYKPSEPPTNSEQHGWDAYRKWLSRGATQSPGERTPLDRTIYSWRGYHTWADKIRRSWDDDKT
jgi:hypothetical protein